jgi:hypothetical protein
MIDHKKYYCKLRFTCKCDMSHDGLDCVNGTAVALIGAAAATAEGGRIIYAVAHVRRTVYIGNITISSRKLAPRVRKSNSRVQITFFVA